MQSSTEYLNKDEFFNKINDILNYFYKIRKW